MGMDTTITTCNTAIPDAASEILGKNTGEKNPGSPTMFSTSVVKGNLKKMCYKTEGAEAYRKGNKRIQKAVKKAKKDWIGHQCEELKTCLHKNNSKRTHQLVKDLNSEKQGSFTTIQDKSWKYLTEKQDFLSRWTEHCLENTIKRIMVIMQF